MDVVKQIRLTKGNELVAYDIGANSENISCGDKTLDDALNEKQNQELSQSILIGDVKTTTVEGALTELSKGGGGGGTGDIVLKSYEKHVSLNYGSSQDRIINLDMANYVYDVTDTIMVYINGLFGIRGVDWTLTAIAPSAGFSKVTVNVSGSEGVQEQVSIVVLKIVPVVPYVAPAQPMTTIVGVTNQSTPIATTVIVEDGGE